MCVFTAKCGENLKDVIFCCEKCSQPNFETLCLQLDPEDSEKTFCKNCVKKYLRETFFYFKSIEFI